MSSSNEIQDIQHAAVIAIVAEAVVVIAFIGTLFVWAALASGA